VAFGTGRSERTQLYIANVGVNFGVPSVMKADVAVPGVPLPWPPCSFGAQFGHETSRGRLSPPTQPFRVYLYCLPLK
jgi:hypothetical protein